MPDSLEKYLNKKFNKFVVQNITPDRNKTIHLFGYPIGYLNKRDLLGIYQVDTAMIKDSLARGVLRNRILARDILVLESDIALTEYNLDQQEFLSQAGITLGYDPNAGMGAFKVKNNIKLVGTFNSVNRLFYFPEIINFDVSTPSDFSPVIYHNGRLLYQNQDYFLNESNGESTGFDQIRIVSFAPTTEGSLVANYFVKI